MVNVGLPLNAFSCISLKSMHFKMGCIAQIWWFEHSLRFYCLRYFIWIFFLVAQKMNLFIRTFQLYITHTIPKSFDQDWTKTRFLVKLSQAWQIFCICFMKVFRIFVISDSFYIWFFRSNILFLMEWKYIRFGARIVSIEQSNFLVRAS